MSKSTTSTDGHSRFSTLLTSCLVVSAGAGLTKLGMIPVLVAGLTAWAFGRLVANLIETKIKNKIAQQIIGIALIAAVFLTSVTVGLLAQKIKPNASRADTKHVEAVHAPQPEVNNDKITLETLKEIAKEQNKNTPVRTSPNVELTQVSAGPDLTLTYKMRVLAAISYSQEDLDGIKLDAITEGCSNFRAGLMAGITYVIAYHQPDGTEIVRVPITRRECNFQS